MFDREKKCSILIVASASFILASQPLAIAMTWTELWQTIKQNYQNSQPTDISSDRASKPSVKCTETNGNFIAIDRDASESIIFISSQAVRASSKGYINGDNHQRCQIESRSPQERISLTYAIADDSQLDRLQITISIDGRDRITKFVNRGQLVSFPLDIKGVDFYTVIFTVPNGVSGYIHLIELP